MLPACERSCQASNLMWGDSISSRRDDIRCRFELNCQLRSTVEPQMNNPAGLDADGRDGRAMQEHGGSTRRLARWRCWEGRGARLAMQEFHPGKTAEDKSVTQGPAGDREDKAEEVAAS